MAKKKNKKKARKTPRTINPSMENCHHLLWQARHWNQGYSKALRNHPYMKKMMPKDTLHKSIHNRIADVPVPSNALCKKAFEEVERQMRLGTISLEDTAEKRIDFLLGLWKFDECPRTVLMLIWQKEIISKFYSKGDS